MSWNDAQQYIRHPTAKTGHSYSLPGEVQWEHAARASSATAYHTGDTLAPQLAMLDVRGGAVKVDTYLVDGLGLHDIHSNVWEWVQDCHDPQACGGRAPSDGAAHVPTGCDSLALRGGSWKDGPGLARAALRYLNHPEFRYYSVDFRVGRVLPID